METFGFLGLAGPAPRGFDNEEFDDDDAGIAFVTLLLLLLEGIRLVELLELVKLPLEPRELPFCEDSAPDVTSAKPLTLRFSAVFNNEAN